MGVRGRGMRELRAALRGMPLELRGAVVEKAAPALTTITRNAFDSAQTVYGNPRPESVNGGPLSLRKTGRTAAEMQLKAEGGRIVKCEIGPEYARYLIGKYKILPNGPLPASFSRKLGEIVSEFKPK